MTFHRHDNRGRDPEELRVAAKARGQELIRRRRHALTGGLAIGMTALVGAGVFLVVFGPRSSVTSPPGISGQTSTSQPTTATTTPTDSVPTVTLPSDQLYGGIAVVNGRLVLTGETTASAESQSPRCTSVTVNAQTLELGSAQTLDCNDPTTSGASVGVVVSYLQQSNNATVRIATDQPGGGFTEGPIIFTFAHASDTAVVTAYGGGWLWVYDVATTNGAELFQVSDTTGQVENTVMMPRLFRPIMAANDTGLWIGNSIEGSPANTLYLVTPGSPTVTTVAAGSLYVYWMVGDGNHLWAGIGAAGATHQTIARYDGSDPRPVFQVPDDGFVPWFVVGGESDGLWTMQWDPPLGGTRAPGPTAQQIIHIDPDTGSETVVARIPPVPVPPGSGQEGLTSGQSVFFDGSFYLLEPPFRLNGYLGYTTLLRIPTSG